jgi:hypothetical protein
MVLRGAPWDACDGRGPASPATRRARPRSAPGLCALGVREVDAATVRQTLALILKHEEDLRKADAKNRRSGVRIVPAVTARPVSARSRV